MPVAIIMKPPVNTNSDQYGDKTKNVLVVSNDWSTSLGTTVASAGDEATIDATSTINGKANCLKLTDADGTEAVCNTYMPLVLNDKFKFKCLLKSSDNTKTDTITFQFLLYDGTTLHRAGFLVDYTNGKIQYLNSAGGFTDVTGGTFNLAGTYWHSLSFSWDSKNALYGYLRFDQTVFDLSAISSKTEASAAANVLCIGISVANVGANNNIPCYFSDMSILRGLESLKNV